MIHVNRDNLWGWGREEPLHRSAVDDRLGEGDTVSMMQMLEVLEPESCDGCGLCCEEIGSPVLLYQSLPGHSGPHPQRPEGLPQELIEEIDEHFLGLSRGEEPVEQCLWYDVERKCCSHYEWRPRICRDFEMGGDACVMLRKAYLPSK